MKILKNTFLAFLMIWLYQLNAQSNNGIDFGAAYTGEIIKLIRGGSEKQQSYYLDNLDLQIKFDTKQLGLWSGGSAFAYFLSNMGADPSTFIGDAQVTSNIEAFDSQRLYELWYNQAFGNGLMEILVGLHDLNSEFYTSDCGGLFTNSSFGIGADVSANAAVGIFNVAALGTRVRYNPSDKFNLIAAVYDGDPGDPAKNHNGLKIDWDQDQGLMSIVEAQFNHYGHSEENGCNSYRVGSWYHSGIFEKINNGGSVRGNYGMYFSIDRVLSQNFNSFIHGGFASGERSTVPYYIGTGFSTTGISAYRPDDVFGIAVASAYINEHKHWEITIESTWQIMFKDFLSFHPDVQYVIHPNGNNEKSNAMIVGIRTEVGF